MNARLISFKKLRVASWGLLLSLLSTSTAQAEGVWEVKARHYEIGLYAGLVFPSGDHELYEHSGGRWEELDKSGLEFGLRAGVFFLPSFGVEAEGEYALLNTRDTGARSNVWRVAGHLVAQYPRRLSPFILLGGGALGTHSDLLGTDTDGELHWGLGAKFYITRHFGVRVDGRHIITGRYIGRGGDPGHWFELNAGLSLAFGRHDGVHDRDGDGVADAVDQCPDDPGIKADGCPDTDGDGLSDRVDKCPTVAAKTPDGCPPDADGDGVFDPDDLCPKTPGTAALKGCADTDGDGVTDDKDECPKEPGTLPNGCPDPDPDKDGVLGEADICPTTPGVPPRGCPPEDADGDGIPDKRDACDHTPGVEPDGCPPDTDGDGIRDPDDKCVNEPETKNAYQDGDGCPDELPQEVKAFTGAIEGINFRTGSARILKSSFEVLDAAAALLQRFPDTKIRIEGHTDSRGRRRTNRRISQRRANAVRNYLLESGVASARIKAVGYGESKPIASNRTRRGRAKNRRIEFTLID